MSQIITKEVYLLTTFKHLVALQFAYETKSLEENFQTLVSLIETSPNNSIITAPELCLSGYNYANLDKSAQFSQTIIPKLLTLSSEKLIVLTLIEKKDDCFFNNLKVFYQGKIVHSRGKYKLFPLGEEEKHFSPGKKEEIQILTINGIKLAFLVCFELRFSELWKQIQGSDVICLPAFWGNQRKEHFRALTQTLAIMNQAYVIASNSADTSMASCSGVITPFGEEFRDDTKQRIQSELNLQEIQKMRKYIKIGLS